MIILDTHALVWWVTEPRRIPREATRAIDRAVKKDEMLGVSAMSIWEISQLAARRRIRLTIPVEDWLDKIEVSRAFAFYAVDNRVAKRSVTLKLDTGDPADRIIVATAIEHGATLVTADEQMRAYDLVKTLWD